MSTDDDFVRDLLREARADEPMPDDVAARLDDVLAGLADPAGSTSAGSTKEAEEAGEAEVLPFRRRLAPKVLAAAAAVVVLGGVGVGLGQVFGPGGMNDSATMEAGGESAQDDGADGDAAAVPTPTPDGYAADQDLKRLSEDDLERDLRQAARDLATPLSGAQTLDESRDTAAAKAGECPSPELADSVSARTEVVQLDGFLALLVVGPRSEEGLRPVELWNCQTDTLVQELQLKLE